MTGYSAGAEPRQGLRTTLRTWGVTLLALVVAGAGLFALASSSTTTSLLRMAVAAGVLSLFATAIGVMVSDPERRTLSRCLLGGGVVPLVVGLGTAALTWPMAGVGLAALALVPWVVGAVVSSLAGPVLPDLRLSRLRELRLLRRDRHY